MIVVLATLFYSAVDLFNLCYKGILNHTDSNKGLSIKIVAFYPSSNDFWQ